MFDVRGSVVVVVFCLLILVLDAFIQERLLRQERGLQSLCPRLLLRPSHSTLTGRARRCRPQAGRRHPHQSSDPFQEERPEHLLAFTVLQRLRSGSSAEHAEADETDDVGVLVCVSTVMITTFLVAMRTSALLTVRVIGREASVCD